MGTVNDKGQYVLLYMQQHNMLPVEGAFVITEDLLALYMKTYGNLFSSKKGLKNKKQQTILARKIAGLTFLKELRRRNCLNQTTAGLVYMISNPAYPEHVKIGMTIDLETRLNSYQTYDPYRQFTVEHYEFVLDRRYTETKILNSFHVDVENGEWIKRPKATTIFLDIIKNNIPS